MTNPNDPAFPIIVNALEIHSSRAGLSKREYFAAMAMQGLIAGSQGRVKWNETQFAMGAINLADALIAELNKEKP